MSENFPKYYLVVDMDALDLIREWALTVANRCQLIEERQGDRLAYKVVVNDALGMDPVSPAFEQEFAQQIESWTPGA